MYANVMNLASSLATIEVVEVVEASKGDAQKLPGSEFNSEE